MTTPIYVKSAYSFLSSLITIDDLISFGIKNNLKSLCLCDDNMHGVMEFIKKCNANDIKPIVGLDLGFCLVFAKNYNGYKNLLKLATIKSKDDVTKEILVNYHTDLICIIPSITDDLTYFTNLFDDFYIGFNNDEEYNLIKEQGYLPLYIKKTLCLENSDIDTLKYLLMLRDNKTLSDDYVFDKDVCVNEIKNDYISDINDFLDKCNLILPEYKLNLPNYVSYHDTKGMDSDEYLYNLSIAGLNKRLLGKITVSYKDRLLHELDVIKKMGFSNYFLIVYDYIRYAKKNDILVGPGRGSAAGSLVSYSLGITEIDPMKYNLLFERFLNSERVTMPDIDTDFPDILRDDVINYVRDKYGIKKVAGIVAFGTFGTKMALRDMGRVLNVPLYTVDELCKMIKNPHVTLQEMYDNNTKFKLMIDSDNKLKVLFNSASRIEGLPRHTTIHAAGIIMANNDLDEIIPLTYNDDMYLSGYEASFLEELGLLKMDFLGIKNLTTIKETLNLINEHLGKKISFNDIPLDDRKTNELFQRGDTLGIFQFESSGMREFLKKLKPNSFLDIYNATAFYRPGPSESIPLYLRRRDGIEHVIYPDKSLEDILKSTYGIIVYQEQIMMIAVKMASFSLGEADILRRAMSKKKVDILKEAKGKFIEGSVKNGYSKEVAEQIYDLVLNFASYGFNKSHSVAYGMVSYKMAYLKANYTLYFYLSLLNSVTMDDEKTISYIKEMKKNNLKIMKPDINKSDNNYKLYYDSVILPFTLIKGISNVISNKIVKSRGEGFSDIYDFFSKAVINNITKNNILSLIDSGSLDSFGYTRNSLYENIDSLINYGNLTKDLDPSFVLKPEITNKEEFGREILIANEKNTFGFYLTNHPVSIYKTKYKNIINLVDAKNYFNKNVSCIVMIDRIKEVVTKKNEVMAFMTASDEETSFDFVLFPKVYSSCDNLVKGAIIKVDGKIERRNDYQMIVSSIEGVN